MIHITGDTHGEQARIPLIEAQAPVCPGDILIVCGDFGYLFRNDEAEHRFLDQLAARDYTICFVDGNHEDFDALEALPEEDWMGGRVHRLRPNILHLMRGYVFTLEGKTFFTMGGAYSVDRHTRTPGRSWWPQELPRDEEYRRAAAALLARNMQVDYILTHTMPAEAIRRMGCFPDPHDAELTGFLEWVMYETRYTGWFCGHWHQDRPLPGNIRLLWFDVCSL